MKTKEIKKRTRSKTKTLPPSSFYYTRHEVKSLEYRIPFKRWQKGALTGTPTPRLPDMLKTGSCCHRRGHRAGQGGDTVMHSSSMP